MELAALQALKPEQVRTLLPDFLGQYVQEPNANRKVVEDLHALLASWTDAQLASLLQDLQVLGEAQQVYPAHPLGQQLSRLWAGPLLSSVQLTGLEQLLSAAAAGPTAVICNHTSYFDSTAIDTILAQANQTNLCDRLMSAAGPKVYSSLFRRIASLCLSTLPVPQSTSLGHTQRLSRRDLARLALNSVRLAHQALAEGRILLIFPEGSRTRTGRLRPFLKGVYRYLDAENLQVVPAALVGCNQIMQIDTERCSPGPVSLAFGTPLRVAECGGGREALVEAHQSISSLLPDSCKPISGEEILQ